MDDRPDQQSAARPTADLQPEAGAPTGPREGADNDNDNEGGYPREGIVMRTSTVEKREDKTGLERLMENGRGVADVSNEVRLA